MLHPFVELEEEGIKSARLIETAADIERLVCNERDTEIEDGFAGHYQTYEFGQNSLMITFLSGFDDKYKLSVDVGAVAIFGQNAATITVHHVATRSIPPSLEDDEYWEAMLETYAGGAPDSAAKDAREIAKKIGVPNESDIDLGPDRAIITIRKLVTELRALVANATPAPSAATVE
jgi:hypothetical protein